MQKNIKKREYRASNIEALKLLILPIFLIGTFLFLLGFNDQIFYIISQLILGIIFTQFFILMHEAGHKSFFKSKLANKILGYISGFFALVPFHSWKKIHDLHHKWTGWRDKDPNTKETIQPNMKGFKKMFVDICWLLFIPVFSLMYRINNYWIPGKLKKYLKKRDYKISLINIVIQVLIYMLIFLIFYEYILINILPGMLIGLMITELIIVSQHSHIDIPISNGSDVKRVHFVEQVKYSRSIELNHFISKYLLFHFNLHEKHHAYPWVPAYYINKIEIETVNNIAFSKWFAKSKRMKGSEYLFKTTKHTGKKL